MTYKVRLYITFKKKEDFESYCAMFEDFGWDFISGGKNSNIQYLTMIVGKSRR
ncbi:DUF2812 domain-containing protein [Metaclostridioides mangenotii]|uniref:DUF2812 domain-containing protein n=1 Tax=Metaclostridioides mangenotii TaxID=1540 RepID=UPI00163B1504